MNNGFFEFTQYSTVPPVPYQMSNQASNHTVPIVERPNDRASSLPRAVDPLGASYPLPDVPGPVDDYPTDGTGVQYQYPMDTFTQSLLVVEEYVLVVCCPELRFGVFPCLFNGDEGFS